ncbi:hypothetical protein OG897_16340 [Streptomyces sp. NBC_00237]|uniref:hypothetical protein n=1 Tax=Streptomyces sp. NBC_00237 TaxID=2975687 RepID=UPI00225671B1|nr:hypothetical protein [Streptomyces sp. NBC_00237]MCX5203011.1 hypothetical protein [Streptomyces sp. NBC_00237]
MLNIKRVATMTIAGKTYSGELPDDDKVTKELVDAGKAYSAALERLNKAIEAAGLTEETPAPSVTAQVVRQPRTASKGGAKKTPSGEWGKALEWARETGFDNGGKDIPTKGNPGKLILDAYRETQGKA